MTEYLTADLDEPTRLEISKAWIQIRNMTGSNNVMGRVSSGGYGVHIRSHEVLPPKVPIAETERRIIGDDQKRIDGDVSDRLCHNQVLFDSKGDKQAGEWHHRLESLIKAYKRSVEILPENEERYVR